MTGAAPALRGADLLARGLLARGVTHVFALSGNQIMPVFDALLSAGITVTHHRHEGACVYAAEGYAQLSGRVGVALVTAGAGLGNAVGALVSARASDTPVLLLSGDSPLGQDGRGAFQELDQCAITAAVTKRSERVATAAGMGLEICAAMDLAAEGRPGPVHLALPADALLDTVDTLPHLPEDSPAPAPVGEVAAQLAGRLAAAHAPLILLGPALNPTRAPGVAERLTAALGAPVRCMESPRGLNDPSQTGLAPAIAAADHVLSLGKQVDFTTKFGAGTAIWDVVLGDTAGLEAAAGNLGPRLGQAIAADPRSVAEAMAAPKAAAMPTPAPALPEAATQGPITSASLAHALRAGVPDGLITLIDGGEIGQWAQAAIPRAPRMTNGPSGGIGGILPAAIGASHAHPGQRILAVMGDGTLGFHLSDLETIAREGLPITLLVGNDLRWNAEHQIQLRDYGAERAFACALSDADYAATAASLGLRGRKVEDAGALSEALNWALQGAGPCLLDIRMDGLPAPKA